MTIKIHNVGPWWGRGFISNLLKCNVS